MAKSCDLTHDQMSCVCSLKLGLSWILKVVNSFRCQKKSKRILIYHKPCQSKVKKKAKHWGNPRCMVFLFADSEKLNLHKMPQMEIMWHTFWSQLRKGPWTLTLIDQFLMGKQNLLKNVCTHHCRTVQKDNKLKNFGSEKTQGPGIYNAAEFLQQCCWDKRAKGKAWCLGSSSCSQV